MKKKYCYIGCLALAGLLTFTGCNSSKQNSQGGEVATESPQPSQDVNETEIGIEYTNLVDDKTRNEVADELLKAGVSEDRVNTFVDWVEEYNDNVKEAKTFHDGYTSEPSGQCNYDDVTLKQEYDENGRFIMDMNCRLTAYLLFGDKVDISNYDKEYDSYLMFDAEEIENEERFQMFRDNAEKFYTLFNPVLVKDDATLEEHVKAIEEAWKERGITIETGNENISLITMYLHDNLNPGANKRFVGHTGVLVENEDGLLFVEKYGWNKPFQVTKFKSQEELLKYLTGRPDIVADGTEQSVLIFKNQELITPVTEG